MAQIELKFESFEELVDFSKKILGVADEQAHPVYRESKGTNGAQSAAPIQQTPAAVPPVQPAVPVQTTPVQTAAPVQAAPVAPVVPTVEHTYTLDDLANADLEELTDFIDEKGRNFADPAAKAKAIRTAARDS